MSRGEVIYTAGWVLGYVIACVFYLYITKDNEYTMAKYIDDFKSLAVVYVLAYFLFRVLFSVVFYYFFDNSKLGWTKRAFLTVVATTVLAVILVSFFGVSFFPFNMVGEDFLSILFSAWVLIAVPVFFGLGIILMLAEALGVDWS